MGSYRKGFLGQGSYLASTTNFSVEFAILFFRGAQVQNFARFFGHEKFATTTNCELESRTKELQNLSARPVIPSKAKTHAE